MSLNKEEAEVPRDGVGERTAPEGPAMTGGSLWFSDRQAERAGFWQEACHHPGPAALGSESPLQAVVCPA